MIKTYKIKHGRDFTSELRKARQVAQFCVGKQSVTNSDVRHFGLKSDIVTQVIRKYGRNHIIKRISKIVLPVSGSKMAVKGKWLWCSQLGIGLNLSFIPEFEKLNQIEVNNEYAYVSVTHREEPQYKPNGFIGVDLNATGDIAVCASDKGVMRLGKKAPHVHLKYKRMRRKLQMRHAYRPLKRIKRRESNIVRDLNHKISRKIVDEALKNKQGIRLENLKGIRKRKVAKAFRHSLNSWSFHQLKTFIEYKAKLLGVPVEYIDPAYTSQRCSRCGLIGNRDRKMFKCSCGHVANADVNAAYNISVAQAIGQLPKGKGRIGRPQKALTKGGQL